MVVHAGRQKVMNFESMVQEVLLGLGKLVGVETPTYTRETVSYNAPVVEADAKCKALEDLGFLVVETYGSDFDMGQVLVFALGEDKETIVKNHVNHLISCAVSPSIRGGYDLVIVKNGNVYESDTYNWEEDRYERENKR